MHVQQATYANELHVNVQHLSFHKKKEKWRGFVSHRCHHVDSVVHSMKILL